MTIMLAETSETSSKNEAINSEIVSTITTGQHQNGIEYKTPSNLPFYKVGGGSLGRYTVLFSADSIHFITSNLNSIHVYHTATSMPVRIIRAPEERGEFFLSSLVRNPQNDQEIYSATSDGYIDLWNFITGQLLNSWKVTTKIRAMLIHANHPNTAFVVAIRPKKKKHKHSTEITQKINTDQKFATVLLKVPLFSSSDNKEKAHRLETLPNGFKCMCISEDGKYIVLGLPDEFRVVNLETNVVVKHHIGHRQITCLAIHPTEPIVAVGDVQGKITLWYCLNDEENKRPMTSILHWHAHAVATVVFAKDGVTMLSGGEEAVLVIWQLPTRQTSFVPRLGSKIFNISISPDNLSYAISQQGNMVRVISAVDQRTQQAVTGLRAGSANAEMTIGLVFEPRNKLIALNGLPGFIQFINAESFEHVMELEVTPGNRISRFEKNEIIRARVQHAAFSCDGEWMSTLESRGSGPHEQQLKFWKYDSAIQSYTVNTRVDQPHDSGNVLSLRMHTNSDALYTCITTGDDNKFRLWNASMSSEANDVRWSCKFIGMYKSETPTDACISLDGSLIAVAEKHVVTLWDTSTFTLQGVLTFPSFKWVVEKIAFAADSPYLFASTKHDVLVWNLLTCTVWWSLPIRVSRFVSCPNSPRLFVSENKVGKGSRIWILQPESPIPLAFDEMKTTCSAATFLPNTSNVLVLDYSCLLYIWGNDGMGQKQSAEVKPLTAPSTSLFNNLFGDANSSTLMAPSASKDVKPPITSSLPVLTFLQDKPSHQLPPPRKMMSSLMELLLSNKSKL